MEGNFKFSFLDPFLFSACISNQEENIKGAIIKFANGIKCTETELDRNNNVALKVF